MRNINHKRLNRVPDQKSKAFPIIVFGFFWGGILGILATQLMLGNENAEISSYVQHFIERLHEGTIPKPTIWSSSWSVLR